MRFWILILTSACLACAGETGSRVPSETPTETAPLVEQDVAHSLQEISQAAVERVGSAIGGVREARFLGDGRRVLVLDRYAPFLRLFDRAGDSLWAGGQEGGGPKEFQEPQTLALTEDGVLVFQIGKASLWGLHPDSLFFRESIPLPLNLIPLGATLGCRGELLLYARNGEQILSDRSPEGHAPPVDYLFTVPLPINGNGIRPIWSDDSEQPSVLFLAHSGLLLSRNGGHLVALHRPSQRIAGEYIEFDCSGALSRRFPEIELAAGGSIPVKEPRTRAQEWPMGVVALPDGFVALQQRYYSKRIYGEDAKRWRSEFFLFRSGVFQDSNLVDEQWLLLDIDPEGNLLLGGEAPIPHFATVPLSAVFSRLDPEGE